MFILIFFFSIFILQYLMNTILFFLDSIYLMYFPKLFNNLCFIFIICFFISIYI